MKNLCSYAEKELQRFYIHVYLATYVLMNFSYASLSNIHLAL